jgi:hypothetical protein
MSRATNVMARKRNPAIEIFLRAARVINSAAIRERPRKQQLLRLDSVTRIMAGRRN